MGSSVPMSHTPRPRPLAYSPCQWLSIIFFRPGGWALHWQQRSIRRKVSGSPWFPSRATLRRLGYCMTRPRNSCTPSSWMVLLAEKSTAVMFGAPLSASAKSRASRWSSHGSLSVRDSSVRCGRAPRAVRRARRAGTRRRLPPRTSFVTRVFPSRATRSWRRPVSSIWRSCRWGLYWRSTSVRSGESASRAWTTVRRCRGSWWTTEESAIIFRSAGLTPLSARSSTSRVGFLVKA
mmetsp:Transcript_50384/g.90075  ORF Transcript_50384/g.90075 Transcript_50384/m.90075 type:complete len:235 (-) Transcript_50384:807-1511(-)